MVLVATIVCVLAIALAGMAIWKAWPEESSSLRGSQRVAGKTAPTRPSPGPGQPPPALENAADSAPLPVTPFILKASKPERERAVRCLTLAIYYEAALEPDEGQRAVAQVVINRMRDANFPKSICGVVFQGWEKLTGCQFSFTCDGSLLRPPLPEYWERAKKVAVAALGGAVDQDVGTATHYHTPFVDPWWRPTVVRIRQIGGHIFYRWPGVAGSSEAFNGRYAGGETKLAEAVLNGTAPRPDAPPDVLAGVTPADPTAAGLATAKADGSTVVTAPGGGRVHATFAGADRPQASPDRIRQINASLLGELKAQAEKPAEPTATPAKD